MFDWQKIEYEINSAIEKNNFQKFLQNFIKAKSIGYIGHGGNLAIADHAAIDATRHTEKNCIAPGSGILVSSLFNDFNDEWQSVWVQKTNCDLYIVITASGKSKSIQNTINYLEKNNIDYIVITGTHSFINEILLNLDSYHEFEVAALAFTYKILEKAGYNCPKIKKENL